MMRGLLLLGAVLLGLGACALPTHDTNVGDVGDDEAELSGCIEQCGVGCAAPGTACYSDGQTYCSACVAACHGATPVACPSPSVEQCVASCSGGDAGCPAPGTICFSDGLFYCNACAAACNGVSVVACPAPSVEECVAGCPIGCTAPGSVCYSDGQSYCNACAAACHGATQAACPAPADSGSDVTACVQACGVGCAAPGSTCYSDGKNYCSSCAAACYGATPVACP